MLRGSSRHDGIPIKQSAKDRDRDRQREQQRKERAQMLPDEKEVHPSAQDLFQPPCRVQQPYEDTTAVQIQNTLGSFDSVRHLILDSSSRRLANLVGVDQGTPVRVNPSEPPPYRPPNSGSAGLTNSIAVSESISTKSNYQRGLFPVNHHPSAIINNIHSSQSTTLTTSNSGSSLTLTNSFRTVTSNLNPPTTVQKVPHSQNPLPQHNTNIYTSNSTLNTNFSSASASNYNSGPILSTKSPNLSSNISSNNQVRSSKSNPSYGHNSNSASSLDFNADGVSGSSNLDKNNSVFDNVSNNSSNAPNDKSAKSSASNKKSTLERADSQLELETILKEMTDVTPPLTAIQTPVKENSSTRKLPQRRSSKSEDKIVQSIIGGMANVPSPVSPVPLTKMDSSSDGSSSYDTDSDTESEDSSSGSHSGTDKVDNAISQAPSTSSPTQRSWSLNSFIKKPGLETSSKEGKSNSFSSVDSEQSSEDLIPHPDISLCVSSTSLFNQSQSASPIENASSVPISNIANHTKAPGRTRANPDNRPESHIPSKLAPSSIPTKGSSSSNNKISSLTASSSDEEVEEKPKKVVVPKSLALEEKKTTFTGAGTRKRPRQLSSSNRHARKSDGDSSPENVTNKTKKVVQDRNKSDTIRKLFRPTVSKKVESPNLGDIDTNKGNNGTATSASGGKQSNNRVSGKDSGRKGTPSLHNGELDVGSSFIPTNDSVASKNKKDGSKEKDTGNKKHPKQPHNATSHGKSPSIGTAVPSVSAGCRLKDETSSKPNTSHSSLIVRIPLEKINRKPRIAGSSSLSASLISPVLIKNEKDGDKGSRSGTGGSTVGLPDSHRLKVQNHSSRVGSSSDTSNQPFVPVDPSITRDRDDPLCSDHDRVKNHSSKKRPRKKSRSSPRKTKIKREQETYHSTKVEEQEISSNVSGYNCDFASVSTTRTPPIESDVLQAPDSSLNPPHLPSPVIPQQIQYFSLFEKTDHKDDMFSRDQDTCLEEAKKLKHSADQERNSTTQISLYLEAGLYFILTGILMERDISSVSSIYTMFKDTLSLITFIGNRWRSRAELQNNTEAKIIILSMRCQALLSLKLFKLKMRETKEMVNYMQDYFNRPPPRDPTITNSPILSTPSPHSPTSSPAGSSASSGIFQHTPSPHHPHQNHHHVTPIPRTLYAQMHKHCNNALNVILAHDTWEQADALVAKHHVEEFFIGIDRQFGPLTLHSSLVDLVRYVRHGIQLMNSS